MEDCQLKEGKIWEMIAEENHRQIAKWGIQDRGPFEWLAYVTEELGELAEAISEAYYRQGNYRDVVKEAIQVATLSMKIAEMYYIPNTAKKDFGGYGTILNRGLTKPRTLKNMTALKSPRTP